MDTNLYHTIKGSIVKREDGLHFPITLIHGGPGSGKSRSIKDDLVKNKNAIDSDFHIIDPLSEYASFHNYNNVYVFETAHDSSEGLRVRHILSALINISKIIKERQYSAKVIIEEALLLRFPGVLEVLHNSLLFYDAHNLFSDLIVTSQLNPDGINKHFLKDTGWSFVVEDKGDD